jgi:hypothetical protein
MFPFILQEHSFSQVPSLIVASSHAVENVNWHSTCPGTMAGAFDGTMAKIGVIMAKSGKSFLMECIFKLFRWMKTNDGGRLDAEPARLGVLGSVE